MNEHKIYILLTRTGTVLSRLIQLYTRKNYNHASICFHSSFMEVYSFGRKVPRNPFIGGFVKEDIRASFFSQASCAVYSYTVTDDQLQRMMTYMRKIEEQKERYRYNLLGLFAIAVNKQIDRKYAFFCSQFIATVLQECEVIEFNKPLSHVAPYDLVEGTNFQLEYQGTLANFYKEIDLQVSSSIGILHGEWEPELEKMS
ncbi:hypothetical protein QA612_20775 [Evansella sp. AB-P1]|uniref:hypothetical protein n=1 Tax=Evansella sp. AB-P1 TaxID=3037653 RepID=UPI00241DB114|nr:hypothetical protein [Evansella sp. AB-P1]MDG5789894.1 hypothetical protein [Evansella sp. AB-P1]